MFLRLANWFFLFFEIDMMLAVCGADLLDIGHLPRNRPFMFFKVGNKSRILWWSEVRIDDD